MYIPRLVVAGGAVEPITTFLRISAITVNWTDDSLGLNAHVLGSVPLLFALKPTSWRKRGVRVSVVAPER